ncbi:MAG: PEGA domain-containing protein [Elusimicrobiota bacterium]
MNRSLSNKKLLKRLLIVIPILLISGLSFCITSYAQDARQEDVKKSIQVTNPSPEFSLRIRAEKEGDLEYHPGEKIILSFQSNKDAYITIYQYQPDGGVKIIFPNQKNQRDNVRAGRLYKIETTIPEDSELGTGYIQGFATIRPALLREREREVLTREFPVISSDFMEFTADLRNRIRELSLREWVSTEILEYQVVRPRYATENTGSVMAMSFPQGAEVYLDGEYQGIAPKRIEDIQTGQHVIEFIMPGYKNWSKSITVSRDRITRIEAHLEEVEIYGKISVTCDQPNALVFVDGKEYGKIPPKSNLVISGLKEGFHELTVMKPGSQDYRTWIQTVEVVGGETVSIHVSLSKPKN